MSVGGGSSILVLHCIDLRPGVGHPLKPGASDFPASGASPTLRCRSEPLLVGPRRRSELRSGRPPTAFPAPASYNVSLARPSRGHRTDIVQLAAIKFYKESSPGMAGAAPPCRRLGRTP